MSRAGPIRPPPLDDLSSVNRGGQEDELEAVRGSIPFLLLPLPPVRPSFGGNLSHFSTSAVSARVCRLHLPAALAPLLMRFVETPRGRLLANYDLNEVQWQRFVELNLMHPTLSDRLDDCSDAALIHKGQPSLRSAAWRNLRCKCRKVAAVSGGARHRPCGPYFSTL